MIFLAYIEATQKKLNCDTEARINFQAIGVLNKTL